MIILHCTRQHKEKGRNQLKHCLLFSYKYKPEKVQTEKLEIKKAEQDKNEARKIERSLIEFKSKKNKKQETIKKSNAVNNNKLIIKKIYIMPKQTNFKRRNFFPEAGTSGLDTLRKITSNVIRKVFSDSEKDLEESADGCEFLNNFRVTAKICFVCTNYITSL